jgi:N-acetylglucosamine-6-phosphate deacetylase
VIVKGKEARLENGALAGSILKMNEGLHTITISASFPMLKLPFCLSILSAMA